MTYPQNAPLSRRSGARAGTVRAASLMSIALIALTAGPARAESLEDALAATYNTNPQLNSARAELRQNDELVPQALSNYRPTVTANGQGAYDHLNSNHLVHESYPHSVGLQVTEPLYRGGRTVAQTRVAENTILGQRATLLATEESLLLNAATIYANVVADMAQVTLAKNNEQVLARDLEADRDRFPASARSPAPASARPKPSMSRPLPPVSRPKARCNPISPPISRPLAMRRAIWLGRAQASPCRIRRMRP